MTKLKAFREAGGKTQSYMANLLGITKSAYCMKEKGERVFTVQEALIIAKDLGKKVEKIFG